MAMEVAAVGRPRRRGAARQAARAGLQPRGLGVLGVENQPELRTPRTPETPRLSPRRTGSTGRATGRHSRQRLPPEVPRAAPYRSPCWRHGSCEEVLSDAAEVVIVAGSGHVDRGLRIHV